MSHTKNTTDMQRSVLGAVRRRFACPVVGCPADFAHRPNIYRHVLLRHGIRADGSLASQSDVNRCRMVREGRHVVDGADDEGMMVNIEQCLGMIRDVCEDTSKKNEDNRKRVVGMEMISPWARVLDMLNDVEGQKSEETSHDSRYVNVKDKVPEQMKLRRSITSTIQAPLVQATEESTGRVLPLTRTRRGWQKKAQETSQLLADKEKQKRHQGNVKLQRVALQYIDNPAKQAKFQDYLKEWWNEKEHMDEDDDSLVDSESPKTGKGFQWLKY
jgi:hypothetical protein